MSDGFLNCPDIDTCDTVLNQLRSKTISLSFLMISREYMPHCGVSRLPFEELAHFMSLSSYGVFFPRVEGPRLRQGCQMNQYHEGFYCWSFRKALKNKKKRVELTKLELNDFFLEEDWILSRKRGGPIESTFQSVLSCRLRWFEVGSFDRCT